MIKPWEFRIKQEGQTEAEKVYLSNLTNMCPNQWREIVSESEALNVIIQQLKINHKLNQGKKRKDRMEELIKIRKGMGRKQIQGDQAELT